MSLRLNLGAGPLRRSGEIGVDSQPTAGCDVQASILELPYDDNSAEFVRLDHVLEHLPQRTAPRAVIEAYRVLEPTGTIRVGVPDMRATFAAYLDEPKLGDRLLHLRAIYGSQAHPGEFHQSGWDPELLRDLLDACGFVNIEIANDDDGARSEGICIFALAQKPSSC